MKSLKIGLVFISAFAFSQSNILERLIALNNNGKTWYNIDGYSVTSEVVSIPFREDLLKKVYKRHNISDSDPKIKNEKIDFNNYFITKKQKMVGDIYQTNSYYFVENPNKTLTAVSFFKNGNTDREMEESLVNKIVSNQIPKENFVTMSVESIDFGGRKVSVGNSCYWTALNTLHCPNRGEMNWSVHKTLEDAKQSIENQLNATKAIKDTKIVSEEIVDVEFEGAQTKAKKVVVEMKGLTSALAGMSGGKSLTAYYILENVRNKNMSSVFSFWNNDQINPETKLSPLLEEFIKLK